MNEDISKYIENVITNNKLGDEILNSDRSIGNIQDFAQALAKIVSTQEKGVTELLLEEPIIPALEYLEEKTRVNLNAFLKDRMGTWQDIEMNFIESDEFHIYQDDDSRGRYTVNNPSIESVKSFLPNEMKADITADLSSANKYNLAQIKVIINETGIPIIRTQNNPSSIDRAAKIALGIYNKSNSPKNPNFVIHSTNKDLKRIYIKLKNQGLNPRIDNPNLNELQKVYLMLKNDDEINGSPEISNKCLKMLRQHAAINGNKFAKSFLKMYEKDHRLSKQSQNTIAGLSTNCETHDSNGQLLTSTQSTVGMDGVEKTTFEKIQQEQRPLSESISSPVSNNSNSNDKPKSDGNKNKPRI